MKQEEKEEIETSGSVIGTDFSLIIEQEEKKEEEKVVNQPKNSISLISTAELENKEAEETEAKKFSQLKRNIRGKGLPEFMGQISASVGSTFPHAKLNKDRSVSFFSPDKNYKDFDEMNEYKKLSLIQSYKDFGETISSEYMIEQLEYYANKFGFKTIENQKILETTHHQETNLYEYKINLSPENLDTILKLNGTYSGYRLGGGLLKLTKDFTLKEGEIYMFPVFCFDNENGEKNMMMRADGCQIYEMPSVQLLHLLPDFQKGVDDIGFHWIPKKVESDLYLNRDSLGKASDELFSKSGIFPKKEMGDKIFGKDGHSDITLIIPNSLNENSPIKICKMDENAKNFYSLYGNVGSEELENCQSLEIDAVSFLKEIKLCHESDLKRESEYLEKIKDGDENLLFEYRSIPKHKKEEALTAAIQKIDSIIENLQKVSEFEDLEYHTPATEISEANIEKLGEHPKGCCTIS